MNTPTHACPVHGCTMEMPSHLLMCRGHWAQIPGSVQAAVYTAWRKFKQGRIPLEELRTVQRSAITAVEGGAA